MRTIDADNIKRRIKLTIKELSKDPIKYACAVSHLETYLFMIDEEETVDAVPVIRCKDCKYFNSDNSYNHCWCNRTTGSFEVSKDDFCSFGVKAKKEAK